jgi:NAD(P)-dependent dehydrogenase (short-subunit alcohol dehydrogenase family)
MKICQDAPQLCCEGLRSKYWFCLVRCSIIRKKQVEGLVDMNRIVMITGSTRGIGFQTAAEFLRNGDQVIIFCRHRKHVREAVDPLSSISHPKNILGLVGDVGKAADVKRILAQSLKKFGRIDILINNAGIGAHKPVEKTSEREWDNILATNLKGPFLFIRQVLPLMKKKGRGVIINISSGLGVEGVSHFSAYCASKFGLVGLTEVVADEVLGSDIKVYAVLPGAVNTKFVSDIGLQVDPSGLLAPEYLGKRIFEAAEGRRKSGQLIEVY